MSEEAIDESVEDDDPTVDYSEDYIMEDLTPDTKFESEELTLGDFRNATRYLPDETLLLIQANPDESEVVPLALATTSTIISDNPSTGYYSAVGTDEMSADEVNLAEESWESLKRQRRGLILQPSQ